MKKLNFAIFGALLAISLTTQALAETTIPWTKEGCESVKGIWTTANKATDTDKGCDANHCNGLNFCQSPVRLNWWSALIWCKSIGHKLVELETACPNGLSASFSCANLKGRLMDSGSSATQMPGGISNSYLVLNNGTISTNESWTRHTNPGTALCEE